MPMRWRPFRRTPPVVGLALSGGAVRGAAHCGVLAVLDEQRVPIHVIAGTSAGAMAGAAYASGMPPQEMVEQLQRLSWPRLVRPVLPTRRALFSTTPFTELLADRFGGASFDQLRVPFVAVACDVLTGERVLLTEGDVAAAVEASMAIPGLFMPIEWGEHLLIDGGTVANYPADVPPLYGATAVIGVDVGASPQPEPPGNPVDLLLAAAEIAARQGDRPRADIDIEPDVGEFSSFSFKAVPDLYERGRAAAEAAMPAIEDLLHRR
ncbi:MAG: patatin-like phospholipase family protein [Actinobacteria bacterium]|nr:patatin-like phospholipase family protein [Actinomycetota bacterium]